jgi:hypothetical protein
VFITRRNQAALTHDLEYESLLGAPNDIKSNNFIINLYPLDRDPLRCLFVGRFQIYLFCVRLHTRLASLRSPHYKILKPSTSEIHQWLSHYRPSRRARTLIQESAPEEDDGLTSLFELADKSLSEALEAFSAFDNTRAEKLRRQMEPLAQRARDLLEKFSDAVGKNPQRSGFYVNLIIMARSLEQIIYLIESITEDIIYVAEAKDIRHANNRLAVEKEP